MRARIYIIALFIIGCLAAGTGGWAIGNPDRASYELQIRALQAELQPELQSATVNTTRLVGQGYIDSRNIEAVNWQDKYNDLWANYKHTVWHYDAQAENLRKERDGYLQILKDIGYYKCTDNFTLERGDFKITGETWEHK